MLIHYISLDFDIGLLAIVFKERFTEICLITFILGRVMRTVWMYVYTPQSIYTGFFFQRYNRSVDCLVSTFLGEFFRIFTLFDVI